MFGLGPATRIYLAAGVTDMRKGFEGLYGLVRDRLSCEPLSGYLFLFLQCPAQPVEVLVWDESGPPPVPAVVSGTKKEVTGGTATRHTA